MALKDTFRRFMTPVIFALGVLSACQPPAPPKSDAAEKDATEQSMMKETGEAAASYKDNTTIAQLRDEFSKTEMGREILLFADLYQIDIVYDAKVCDGLGADGVYVGGKVYLHPKLSLEQKLETLAHELKHGYNDRVIGRGDLKSSFLPMKEKYALLNMDEADAAAFSLLFMADRREKLGITTDACQVILDLQKEIRKDGISLQEYRDLALKESFGLVNRGYHDDHIKTLKKFHADVKEWIGEYSQAEDATILALHLQDLQKNTPEGNIFEQKMRMFGGMSFNVKAQTALQDSTVTLADIVDTYPYMGITPQEKGSRRAAFTILEPQMEQVQDDMTMAVQEAIAQGRVTQTDSSGFFPTYTTQVKR